LFCVPVTGETLVHGRCVCKLYFHFFSEGGVWALFSWALWAKKTLPKMAQNFGMAGESGKRYLGGVE
jgi:hypothetical protein